MSSQQLLLKPSSVYNLKIKKIDKIFPSGEDPVLRKEVRISDAVNNLASAP